MRVLHSRGTTHPICELGVGSSLLNSSILLLFRQPLTSSIIVFTPSPTCLLVQTQLQSIQWPWKTIFSQHRPQTIRHFFPLGRCDCRWLRNDFSIPRAPENMSHKNIIMIHFHIWTWYTPTIVISLGPVTVFQYKYNNGNLVIYGRHRRHRHPGGQAKILSWYILIEPAARNFEPAARNFEPAARNFVPPKTRVRLVGVTENAGPKCRSISESERKLHENMLATCSLMYIQFIL